MTSREEREDVDAGEIGWDAAVQTNFQILFDRPLPIAELDDAFDETDLEGQFAAATHRNSLIWVYTTALTWVLYYSDGVTWQTWASTFANVLTTGVASTTMSGNVTLISTDYPIQHFNPNGANRSITLDVTTQSFGKQFTIIHSGVSKSLTLKESGGSTIYVMNTPGETVSVVWSGSVWKVRSDYLSESVNTETLSAGTRTLTIADARIQILDPAVTGEATRFVKLDSTLEIEGMIITFKNVNSVGESPIDVVDASTTFITTVGPWHTVRVLYSNGAWGLLDYSWHTFPPAYTGVAGGGSGNWRRQANSFFLPVYANLTTTNKLSSIFAHPYDYAAATGRGIGVLQIDSRSTDNTLFFGAHSSFHLGCTRVLTYVANSTTQTSNFFNVINATASGVKISFQTGFSPTAASDLFHVSAAGSSDAMRVNDTSGRVKVGLLSASSLVFSDASSQLTSTVPTGCITSANLRTMLTDERGTGEAVFHKSPTFETDGTLAAAYFEGNESGTSFAPSDKQMCAVWRNQDTTTNNWTAMIARNNGGTAAGFGFQNTDQTNGYAEWAIFTRGPSGFGERVRIKEASMTIPKINDSLEGTAVFVNGDIWYNTTDDEFRGYKAGAIKTFTLT